MKRTSKTVLNFLIGVFILFACAMVYMNIRVIWDPGYTPLVGKFLLVGPAAQESWTVAQARGILRGPGGLVIVTITILLIIILYEVMGIVKYIKAADKSKRLAARVKRVDFNKKRGY